jgi:hypothetical protein
MEVGPGVTVGRLGTGGAVAGAVAVAAVDVAAGATVGVAVEQAPTRTTRIARLERRLRVGIGRRWDALG